MGRVTVGSDGKVHLSLSSELFPSHGLYRVPSPGDIGLAGAEQGLDHLAGAALRLSSNLQVWPEAAKAEFEDLFPHASLDRQREISDLLVGSSQSANLVMAALCETSGLLQATLRDCAVESRKEPTDIWDLLRAGFMLEASAQYLVSIGHYLANAGARCALEALAVQHRVAALSGKQRRLWDAIGQPGSGDPKAWIYHQQSQDLLTAIGGRSKALRPLRVAATLYRSSGWQDMVRTRNAAFHRTRDELPASPHSSAEPVVRLFRQIERATQALGRAVPSYVLGMQQASPRVARGKSRDSPLFGPEYVREGPEEEWRLAIPCARFLG